MENTRKTGGSLGRPSTRVLLAQNGFHDEPGHEGGFRCGRNLRVRGGSFAR